MLQRYSASKEYDGEAISHVPTKDLFDVEILDGKTYTWDVASNAITLTNVGRTAMVAEIRFYDETGAYVGAKKVNYGSLEVKPKKLEITTGSKHGTDPNKKLFCYDYSWNGLINGHTFKTIQFTESLTGYGMVQNKIDLNTLKIVDKNGVDVTKNYEIDIQYGWLSIY